MGRCTLPACGCWKHRAAKDGRDGDTNNLLTKNKLNYGKH